MPFILPDDFSKKLKTLRQDYENNAHTKLSPDSQPYAISRFFGRDIYNRNKQIAFIEKMYQVLFSQFQIDKIGNLTLKDDHELHEYIIASRILIAAIIYIKSQISDTYWTRYRNNHSVLFSLLDETLALHKGNIIDEVTHDCIINTTKEFMQKKIIVGSSDILTIELESLVSDPEWKDFTKFIENKQTRTQQTHYPITGVLMPLVAKPFEWAGIASGYTLGEIVAGSTVIQRTVMPKLTTTVSDAIFTAASLTGGGPVGMGVMFLAPRSAALLLRRYSGVSLASILGYVMSLIGQGIGWAIGRPLDALFQLSCYALTSLFNQNDPTCPISGYNLVNGFYYFRGMKMEIIKDNAAENTQIKPIQLNFIQNGFQITIDDDTALVPFERHNMSKKEQELLDKLETDMIEKGVLPLIRQELSLDEQDANFEAEIRGEPAEKRLVNNLQ
jgi:hypothetical protein